MNPTPKLRFVKRSVPMHPFYKTVDADGKFITAVKTVHILQQWWEDPTNYDFLTGSFIGEWRDVAVEKEEA